MVKPLNSRVTLVTLETLVAFVPPLYFYFEIVLPYTLQEGLAIFGEVFKQLWWPSEVTSMVSVDAALGIVRVLLIGTPCSFIFEHVERVCTNLVVGIH